MHYLATFIYCFGLTLFTPISVVAYEITDSFNINGFGTLGIATNDSDEIRYKSGTANQNSIGKWEFDYEMYNVAGLKLRYDVNEALSLTAQGTAFNSGNNTYDTTLDWAFLQYETSYNINIRAGKLLFPIFHSTELSSVGYSRTFLRPPLITFGVAGYNYLEGIQAKYNTFLNPFDISLQGTLGKSNSKTPIRSDGSFEEMSSNDIKIISAKIGKQNFWFNLSYTDINSDVLFIRPFNPAIRRTINVSMLATEWQVRFAGIIIDGGYGRGRTEAVMPGEDVFYSAISYPLNSFTPYVLYSSKQFLNLTAPPGYPAPREADFLDRISSLGVRYDFYPSIAIKFQWDHISPAKVNARFSNKTIRENKSHNAFSLVLDWMF